MTVISQERRTTAVNLSEVGAGTGTWAVRKVQRAAHLGKQTIESITARLEVFFFVQPRRRQRHEMQHQQLEAAAGAATEQHTVYPPAVLWQIRSEDDLFVHLPRLPAALLEQK